MLSSSKTKIPSALSSLPDYSNFKNVGRGATSQVYAAEHKTYKKVCIKVIENSFLKTSLGPKIIKNQVKILEKLEHNNVLHLIEQVKNEGKIMIVTQYYEGGDLERLLRRKNKLDVQTALLYFSGVLQGCLYLQSLHILHRDIKPANIFFQNNQAVLADFGFATYEDNDEFMKLNVGSPYYMAPEALSNSQFSKKSEVFALGAILYEMLVGKTPWDAKRQKQLLQNMKKAPSESPKCSKPLKQIIFQCLSYQPRKRPTLQKLIEVIQKQIQQCKQIKKQSLSVCIPKIKPTQFESKVKKIPVKGSGKQNRSVTVYTAYEAVRLGNHKSRAEEKKKERSKLKTLYDGKVAVSTGNQKRLVNLKKILPEIDPQAFKFLPSSIISKLYHVIDRYSSILGLQLPQISSKYQNLFTLENDQMVKEMLRCQTQKELCFVIQGFIRRLYRLSKSYTGYDKQRAFLQNFHNAVVTKVQTII